MIKTVTLYLLLLLAMLPTAPAMAASPGYDARPKGILWKIEKPGVKPSYILGTVHSDDSRILQLADQFLPKVRTADSFVSELKMDGFSMREASQLMYLPIGKTLESLIGKKRFQLCVSLLAEYGISQDMAQRMKPWAVIVTLSMPKPRTGMVMDYRLYQEAESFGVRTYGLETSREQVAVFESFSIRDQIIMLDDAIKTFSRLPMMFDELIHYYLQGDLGRLERASDKYMLSGNGLLANQFRKRILLDRNYLMVRRMKPRLMAGNSFIAVGALHLPGNEGILQLLVRDGYRLTPAN